MKGHRQGDGEAHLDYVHEPVPPLRAVLTGPVVLSIANYFWLAFIDIALCALHPLFFATPIHLGGLGMSPATIGVCLGIFGLLDGTVQGVLFPEIVRRVGLRKLYLTCLLFFIPLFASFPVINYFARGWGLSPAVWALVVFQLMINCVTEMCFGRCPFLNESTSFTPSVTSIQVARSYTLPPPWRVREHSGACTASDKPLPHSPERWAQQWRHPSSHTPYRMIG